MRQPLHDNVSSDRTSQVVLQLHSALCAMAGGANRVHVASGTVRQALTELQGRHPALVRAVRSEAGEIRPHVNIFVNQQDIRHLQGLETVLKPGDAVIILPSISGG